MSRVATATILCLVLILVGVNWSRFSHDMGEPALLVSKPMVWVLLGQGFSDVGIARQFNDGCQALSVINLTGYAISANALKKISESTIIESGRRVDLIVEDAVIQSIYLSWMPASQRVVLGIPLHPDRMTQKDWEILPGVGAKMAGRIENNRQENGDFGSFLALRRIKGVGARKMEVWREYFY